MNYAEALAFLNRRTNYEVVGLPAADDLRLGRMHALLDRLGDPHRRYRVVHVAGTKGKGSTATMIAELLRAAGARVGLHLSPHLERIEERMRVDGTCPAQEEFAAVVSATANAAEMLDRARPIGEAALTFFELTTAAAFEYFARSKVDWAVIEVGVGGRLDATNVVSPAVSVITEIGLDHTKTLGDTVAAIAGEKAGIIKPGVPVVTSATNTEAAAVIEAVAARNGSPLKRLGRDFRYGQEPRGWDGGRVTVETWRARRTFDWRLLGEHQARNAALAWAAADILAEEVGLPTSSGDALVRLKIPGRLEVLQRRPFTVLLDVAHNEPSAAALAEFLGAVGRDGARTLVFAATRDKNWPAMLRLLVPLFDEVVVTQYRDSPRGTPVGELVGVLGGMGVSPVVTAGPAEASDKARTSAAGSPGGLVCIAGSFFLAAEIRPRLLQSLESARIE